MYHTIFVRLSSYLRNFRSTTTSSAMAWFPSLFYTTIYIGDLYKRANPVATTDEEQLMLDAEAMRLGSHALLTASVVALLINVTLPVFVSGSLTRSTQSVPNEESWWCRVPKCLQINLATMWAIGHLVFASCMFATLCVLFWSYYLLI